MKKLFYIFAIVSLALFVYSAIHLGQQFFNQTLYNRTEFKGFEDVNPNDDYNKLIEKFRQTIKQYDDQAAKDQDRYFWMSFIVTALTAASTLVSSIQAAKKDTNPDPKRAQTFAIIVAALGFCSTLANFASTHLNDLKTEETKKGADTVTMRNQFNADYNKASADNKPLVIEDYAQRLK